MSKLRELSTGVGEGGYRIVRDHAGVKGGRASSYFDNFAEVNRAAMKACGDLQKPVSIFYFAHRDGRMQPGDLIVRYAPGSSGRPVVELAGEPSMPPGTERG